MAREAAKVWNLGSPQNVVGTPPSSEARHMVLHGLTPVADDHDAFLELPHKLDEMPRAPLLLDACEADNVVELTAEVPGVRDSDIDVNLRGDILTISVEKRDSREGKRTHFSERSYGKFQRCIQLPFAPNADSVSANVENGVLVIRFPRVGSDRTGRIAIGGTSGQNNEERSAIGSTWDEKSNAEKPLTLTHVVRTTPPAPDFTAVPRPKVPPATPAT